MVRNIFLHPTILDDPLNRGKKRTIKNTGKFAYNCAGYALECFSWYCPEEEDEDEYEDSIFDSGPYQFYGRDEAIKKTNVAVQIMLNDFPTLRVVQTLAEVQSDEYAILFRLSSDGDFHYLKRDRIGHWRHKMGARDSIDTIQAKDIFNEWCNRYNGPIVIFAKKR